MVPNHMGIDSRWVIEHPEWFLQVPSPPFPSYTFNGPDLSSDQRVAIVLEDDEIQSRILPEIFHLSSQALARLFPQVDYLLRRTRQQSGNELIA